MWILVVYFLLGTNAGGFEMQEMSSRQACEDAEVVIRGAVSRSLKTICIAK